MDVVLEAIYENGVLMPLETLNLGEQQRVRITIHDLNSEESPDAILEAWHGVYEGCEAEEIEQIENESDATEEHTDKQLEMIRQRLNLQSRAEGNRFRTSGQLRTSSKSPLF